VCEGGEGRGNRTVIDLLAPSRRLAGVPRYASSQALHCIEAKGLLHTEHDTVLMSSISSCLWLVEAILSFPLEAPPHPAVQREHKRA